MKQKLISEGGRKCRQLPKASVMPTAFSTNAWSPASHSWMLHDKEDNFSCDLAWKLLTSDTDRHQTQKHGEILRYPRIQSAGESEAALIPRHQRGGLRWHHWGPRQGKGQVS